VTTFSKDVSLLKMKKLFLIVLFILGSCTTSSKNSLKPTVLVTIPPYAYFVEQIAGDNVTTEIFVPPGANPHTYEPSPRQIEAFAQAKIWFRYGDPIEARVLPFLRERHVVDIDLSEGFELLTDDHHHDHGGKDLHIWLDPALAQEQVKRITEELSKQFPEMKGEFETNSKQLIKKLQTLDEKLATQLKPYKGIALLVSHPALGYFCARYGMEQLSIELEGKDPLPQDVALIVEEAEEHEVKAVFTEPQYNNKGAVLIAEKLHIPVYQIDPYAFDYFETMNQIATSIIKIYD